MKVSRVIEKLQVEKRNLRLTFDEKVSEGIAAWEQYGSELGRNDLLDREKKIKDEISDLEIKISILMAFVNGSPRDLEKQHQQLQSNVDGLAHSIAILEKQKDTDTKTLQHLNYLSEILS